MPRKSRLHRLALGLVALMCLLSSSAYCQRNIETRQASLAELQRRYNRPLYQGLVRLRASKAPGEEHVVGDNTDSAGMHWTKCTNLGLDLLAAAVAREKGLISANDAREHTRKVLDVLGALETYDGIFPEFIKLENGIFAERKAGRIRYSSIDSAWVTVALDVIARYYERSDGELARRARALIDKQDYGVFVGKDGLLGAGFWVDAKSKTIDERIGFSYGDRNSEARPLVLALVGMNKLPESAWNGMHYKWTRREGVALAEGYHMSAFVELTGQLLFDEMTLAPKSLGRSHTHYVQASAKVARKRGHKLWGYAPSCSASEKYTEFGLDQPDAVSPYAAAQLATTGDAAALANLDNVLAAVPLDGRAAPDSLDPESARVSCAVARTLDQSLLFLALNVDTVWALVKATPWYAPSARRLRELDRTARPDGEAAPTGLTPSPGENAEAPFRFADTRPPRTEVVERELPTVQRLLDAARTHSERVDLEQSRSDLASASAVRSFLNFLPDAAVVVRRQYRQRAGNPLDDPSWQLELQARAVLSLEKLDLAIAAGDAKDQARARVRQLERQSFVEASDALWALYLAERRLATLHRQRAALDELASGARANGRPDWESDAILLRAQVSALDHEIAEVDGQRQESALRLSQYTGAPVKSSGLSPELELPEVLALIERTKPKGASERAAEAEADVKLQESLLRVAKSRRWYVPELRSGLFVTIPKGSAAAGSTSQNWQVDAVLGELTLAFNLRPEDGFMRTSQAAALERSRWLLARMRAELGVAHESARVTRDALRSAWTRQRTEPSADAGYRTMSERFRRGEQGASAVAAASRTWLRVRTDGERLFARAVAAELALAAHETLPASLRAHETSDLTRAAEYAANADVARARALARALHQPLRATVEAGVLQPLYQQNDRPLLPAGFVVGGPAALVPERVSETSLLARVSLDWMRSPAQERAALAEASLADFTRGFERQRANEDRRRARLELAYARAALAGAERDATTARAELAAISEQRKAGLVTDETKLVELELSAQNALERLDRARGRVRRASLAYRALAGSAAPNPGDSEAGAVASAVVDETARSHPSGGEPAQRIRRAELELERAKARLVALREPPRGLHFLVQGTQGLEGKGYSLGFALGLDLDPVRSSPRILEAAENLGQARGRLRATQAEAKEQTALARRELASAAELRDVNTRAAERARALLDDLQREQASRGDVHPSVKQTERALVAGELARAERRRLQSEQRYAAAELRAAELGVAPASAAMPVPAPQGMNLRELVDRAIERDPEVIAADARARAVDAEDLRPALLGGFHLAGPSLGGSFAKRRFSGQPVLTDRLLSASVGVGASYDLADGLSFLSTLQQESAVEHAQLSARQRARLRALTDLGKYWAARERYRLAVKRERDLRARFDQLVQPRFSAGTLDQAALSAAEAVHTRALGERERARTALERARLRFALSGADVGDAELDAYARTWQKDGIPELPKLLDELERVPGASSASLAEARARRAGARADVLLSLLRVLSPATLFLEFRPEDVRRQILQPGFSDEVRDGGVFWLASLVVPVNLRAFGEASEAVFKLRVRGAEVAAWERVVKNAHAERALSLRTRQTAWRAARARLDAARRAASEMARRYREGDPNASIDTLSQAEDDVFEAQRKELEAHAAYVSAQSELQAVASIPETLPG